MNNMETLGFESIHGIYYELLIENNQHDWLLNDRKNVGVFYLINYLINIHNTFT